MLLPFPLFDVWHENALWVNACIAILAAVVAWCLTITHHTPPVCQSNTNTPPWLVSAADSLPDASTPPATTICPTLDWLKKNAVPGLHLQEWQHQTKQVQLKLQGEYSPMTVWLEGLAKEVTTITALDMHRASHALGGVILEMSLSCKNSSP